ncbi:AAA domain-containing protein [Clostridium sp.]|uniref:AAA domain-containing protein n=1 Tax=Clostridium sp. TaxID=1506 RepID=UPI002FCA6064
MKWEEHLDYAIKNDKELLIESNNGKYFYIKVLRYDLEKISYTFCNTGKEGSIKLKNIKSLKFKDKEDEKDLCYIELGKEYNKKNIKSIVENFKKYYLEILYSLYKKEDKIASKSLINSDVELERLHNTYEFKKNIYTNIFDNLYKQKDNLLINYFTSSERIKKQDLGKQDHNENTNPIILLQPSNKSQKKSIEAAIKNNISIIEGPPGTGKTTTILSIVANMIYANKKVVVVSKNNSAINNVIDELNDIPITQCFIRLGNKKVISELTPILEEKIRNYEKEIKNISVNEKENPKKEMQRLCDKLEEMENDLEKLVKVKNKLIELENNYRHLNKRNEAYEFEKYKLIIKRLNKINSLSSAKKKLDVISELLVDISEEKKIGLIKRFLIYINFRFTLKELKNDGVVIQGLLEKKFLEYEIRDLKNILKNGNLNKLQNEISRIYKEDYIKLSKELVLKCLKKRYIKKEYDEIYSKIKANENLDFTRIKKEVVNLYPIIMTTVDAFIYNFNYLFNKDEKIDCIIIDEASQCDILSALPLLYAAKKIIVVGDSRQLSAIINMEEDEIKTKVEREYNYIKENFLTTISKAVNPESNMLLEHYRCNYNIINYCNRYFYNNKLVIYKESKNDSMILVNNDKGKFVDLDQGSFVNLREIETIRGLINSDIKDKFIITPFRNQANNLCEKYNKEQCGTIHTFQGRGEKEVYFSTVLNDTREGRSHLQSNHNLFTNELINVAVSRAKDKFILVTDRTFFVEYDKNIKNLIKYIETYGEVIPDKTVCIFDYLYKQMKTYTVVDNCDNIFEKTVKDCIDKYIEKHNEYSLICKLPLANVVTDKKFLDENNDIKTFILNNAHLDFTIYDNRINRPVMVIEVDGKYHKEDVQKERDKKKNKAIKHMGIHLWRLNSKDAVTYEEFENYLYRNIN